MNPFFKDEALDRLAISGNVAQFASFDPQLSPRYSRILNCPPNERLELSVATATLLSVSPERKINVRSFKPESYQGNEFIYGLDDVGTVIAHVHRLALLGSYVIINETVDVNDGGVSGVSQGSVVEFAPRGTPRVVDTARPASVKLSTGLKILEAVYGFAPELPFVPSLRVEFSIHPIRRGWRQSHTIIWELEDAGYSTLQPSQRWPNDFSEFVGDKVFGLLIAFSEGFDVPQTKVMSRHLPPFSFGSQVGTGSYWVRTSPRLPLPGRFTTVRGWIDPFKLLSAEDPEGTEISSVLIQDDIPAAYSGALLTDVNGAPIIEGVSGNGDTFMVGGTGPVKLPDHLDQRLRDLYARLWRDFGSIRLEWVFDGERIWVVQLQQEAPKSAGAIIVDGDFSKEVTFTAETGLEKLRALAKQLSGSTASIKIVGNIGVTSHMADILRRANVPSRLVRE